MNNCKDEHLPNLYSQLVQINNEQTNHIRILLKEKYDNSKNDEIYDELTRVNNELANLQREFAKKNAQLEKANNLKNQFIGMAAHDLRNPLNIILSYLEFLLNNTADPLSKNHVDFLKEIYKSSEFMLNLVEDILDVSKIESGKLDLNLEEVDIVELLGRNIKMNKIFAKKKEIKLNLITQLDKKYLYLDSKKMEQVFNNLIGNSIKYSFIGSEIDVRIFQEDENTIITVKDSGLGIEEDMMGEIFNPFLASKKEGTAGEKSTGLGLAIVKKIIDGHNGEIWVESESGKGATFYCKLP